MLGAALAVGPATLAGAASSNRFPAHVVSWSQPLSWRVVVTYDVTNTTAAAAPVVCELYQYGPASHAFPSARQAGWIGAHTTVKRTEAVPVVAGLEWLSRVSVSCNRQP
jgi:hypothetical protein